MAPLHDLMINRPFRGMHEHVLNDPGKSVPPELRVYLQTMATPGERKARTIPFAPVAGPQRNQLKSRQIQASPSKSK